MRFNKYDFINIETADGIDTYIFIKRNNESILVIPIKSLEAPEKIPNKKIFSAISLRKTLILAYHNLSVEQKNNVIYLMDRNNINIKNAIERILNE